MSRHAPVLALVAAIAVILLPRLLAVYADPDLWWHLYVGERILDTGALPAIDDLSFTAAGAPWSDHEWGVEVIMAIAWRAGGSAGLSVLRIGLLLGLTGGLGFLVWRRWRHPLGCAVALLVALPFVSLFINVRAHAFTYTLAVGVLVVLEIARRRPVVLLALPLVMMVWVNLHGGFLLGFVLGTVGLVGLAAGREGEAVRPPVWVLVATGLGMVVAVQVHPHGLELWKFLLRELIFARHEGVSEWQPLQGIQLVPWAVFLFGAGALALAARRWRMTETAMLVLVGASVLRNGRFFPLVVVFATLVGVHALSGLWPRLAHGRDLVARLASPTAPLVLAAVIGLPFLLSFVADAVHKGLALEVLPQTVPIGAVAFLAERDLGPNLAVNFEWGGYAIWHLHDRYRVSADGRNTTVYDDAFIGRYVRTYYDGSLPEWLEGPDVWLVESVGATADTLAADPAWSMAYADWLASVFVPATSDVGWVPGPAGPPAESVAVLFP